ncbi:LysM domain-containing protein [Georgenia subflava]|uniref:LysM domain-containing protein n=1 Tax=Georgenia subflava TaxID=1622177 RepID=A0A6N7EG00_9MICO|nr:LysM domain-containing protein [Georgenia subflava]MPV37322.1 LysM domain-containing protein [Georgenia subflava]
MAGRSRYDGLEVAVVVVADGDGEREVRYLRRRPIPAVAAVPLAHHRVRPDDRLDLISARYLGDPTASWRICDANRALDPDELVGPRAESRILVIPTPGV